MVLALDIARTAKLLWLFALPSGETGFAYFHPDSCDEASLHDASLRVDFLYRCLNNW